MAAFLWANNTANHGNETLDSKEREECGGQTQERRDGSGWEGGREGGAEGGVAPSLLWGPAGGATLF
jgi:hypothetical protein